MMKKTIACLAVAGAAMAANGQELLAWWNFDNSTSDSNLTWADGNDQANNSVFRFMYDNDIDDGFNGGFYDPTTDRLYPVFDGFFINPGALIDPAAVDSFELNVPTNLFGAYVDVTNLTGDNFAGVTSAGAANNTWGSYAGTSANRADGDSWSGGSLAITGSGNNGSSFDVVADLSNYIDIEISWAQRGTGTGFNSRTVSVSTDGVNFTELFSESATLSSTWDVRTVDAGSMLDNASNAIFRFAVDGASSNNGNNRFDNIVLTGTEGMGAACVGDIADDFGSLGGDGMVSFGDFLALLGLVGPCP